MKHALAVTVLLCAGSLPSFAAAAEEIGLVLVADPMPGLGVEGRLRAIVVGTAPIAGSELRVRTADEVGGSRMVNLLEGSAAAKAAIPPPVLPRGGSVHFESLDLPATPVGPATAASAGQAPAKIGFSIHVAEPPATEVAVTAIVRAPSGAEVRRFEGVFPIGPETGPGNSSKRLATGAFSWSFTASDGTPTDDARLASGLYAVQLEARARKRLIGIPHTIGGFARASGTVLVAPGSGRELLAVGEWAIRPSAEGLYAVQADLVDGERVRTGDVRYLQIAADRSALLPYEAAYTLQFAKHLEHVRAKLPAGESPSDSMLIPVVTGDAGSTFGTSLEDDDLAAAFATTTVAGMGTTLRADVPSRAASTSSRVIEGDLMVSLSASGSPYGPEPIAGIRVCLYEADPILDDLLACTHADEAGHYRMTFDPDMGDGLFGGDPSSSSSSSRRTTASRSGRRRRS